jgi:hypothetical protein
LVKKSLIQKKVYRGNALQSVAGPDIGWLVVFVATERGYKRAKAFFATREHEFALSFELESDAMAAMQRRSCIVAMRRAFDMQDLRGTKIELSLDSFLKDWQHLRQLGAFVADYCSQPIPQNLVIMLETTDVESYRLASFIASYCLEKKMGSRVVDSDQRSVEPLYDPPINITTKRCLFSLLDYIIRNGTAPNFEQFRDHHFGNLRLVEVQDPNRTRRDWNNKEDSRYVSALYASVRALEERGLIVKRMDIGGRKIMSIEPTWNGAYSVVFSDLLPVFSQTLVPEE